MEGEGQGDSQDSHTLEAVPWANAGRLRNSTCFVLYSFRGNNHEICLLLWLGYNGVTLCTVDRTGGSQAVTERKERETIIANRCLEASFPNLSQKRILIHLTPTAWHGAWPTARTNVCWMNDEMVKWMKWILNEWMTQSQEVFSTTRLLLSLTHWEEIYQKDG